MRYRLARSDDLPCFVELIHNSFVDRPDIRCMMPRLWASLLQEGALISAVIEDSDGPRSGRVEAVYLGVFVNDGFVEDMLRNPSPRVVLGLYEMMMIGNSPVLGPEAIREANSGDGLNCLILHTGMRVNSAAFINRRLSENLRDMCVLLYSGFRIKCVIEEVVGTHAKLAMEQSGFRLVTDYSVCFRGGACTPSPDDHPYLFMVRAEDVVPGIVSGVSFYFNASEPRFDFAPVQQRVLLHALFNESDEEIAGSLNISVETVRKHWRSIYGRVIRLEPEFFPGGRTQGDARGPEKRRYLLNYLRMHLDEVRPRLRRRTRRGGEQ